LAVVSPKPPELPVASASELPELGGVSLKLPE
jgi:hypothetical protein